MLCVGGLLVEEILSHSAENPGPGSPLVDKGAEAVVRVRPTCGFAMKETQPDTDRHDLTA